jgi:hypothetical protein
MDASLKPVHRMKTEHDALKQNGAPCEWIAERPA